MEDATHHGWASYSFAKHGEQEKLSRELGHCDKRMLNHYLQVNETVRQKAKVYFSLNPRVVLPPAEFEVFQQELSGDIVLGD